jgi:hypothetical protein
MVATEPLEVVEEYRIGNSLIRISDDCCKKMTAQDVERILRRISRKAVARLGAEDGEALQRMF